MWTRGRLPVGPTPRVSTGEPLLGGAGPYAALAFQVDLIDKTPFPLPEKKSRCPGAASGRRLQTPSAAPGPGPGSASGPAPGGSGRSVPTCLWHCQVALGGSSPLIYEGESSGPGAGQSRLRLAWWLASSGVAVPRGIPFLDGPQRPDPGPGRIRGRGPGGPRLNSPARAQAGS